MRGPIAILFVLLLAACGVDKGAESPELATTKFIEALQSGDIEEIYASVADAEAESFSKIDERLDFNRWDYYEIEEFSIKSVEFRGNRAFVTVTLKREVEDEEVESNESVVCLQEGGAWKVTMSSSSKVFLPVSKKPE